MKHPIIALLVLLGASPLMSQRKVLFLGNSYTYFWNLPQHVDLMCESRGIALEASQSTAGGASWNHHWRNERELESRHKIARDEYDVVVLQNHSRSAIDQPDSLRHFGLRLAEEIKRSGGQPMLYMTWAREWDPFMLEPIRKAYQDLAEEIDAEVAPVGEAFALARKLRPELQLYHPDGSHQSNTGTYLAACVFFGSLTDESPIGLPGRLTMKDENGEKLYIAIMTDEDALFCQKVAAHVLKQNK